MQKLMTKVLSRLLPPKKEKRPLQRYKDYCQKLLDFMNDVEARK